MGKTKHLGFPEAGGKLLPELTASLLKSDPERARELLDALPLPARTAAVLDRRGKERFELILLSQESRALTQALPASEWWRTLKEVGEEDALPLVAMASAEQITYLTDLEWWYRDQLDPLLVIRWWTLLLEAGEEALERWLDGADEELLVLSLSKFLLVYVTEPDNEGAEVWRRFQTFTLDNTYYLQFRDPLLGQHLERFVRTLRDHFGDRYYSLLDRVRMCLPAEEEETALRLRWGRLADHGFADYDEAVAVYADLSAERRAELEREKGGLGRSRYAPEPAPRAELAAAEMQPLLREALEGLADPARLEEFRFDFARLVNRLQCADGADFSRPESLSEAAAKAAGYLEIGLETWSGGRRGRARELVQEQHVLHLFQAGWSQALELHRRAQRLEREGWFRRVDNPLELLGEPAGPRVEGLLKKRPQAYAGPDGKGGRIYREFRTPEDVRAAARALAEAEWVGRLFFEALDFSADQLLELEGHNVEPLSWRTILLTALVHGALSGKFGFTPIPAAELPRLLPELFTAEAPRQVNPDLGAAWKEWFQRRVEKIQDFPAAFGPAYLEQCINELEVEVGRISGAPDPRFIVNLVIGP